MALSNAIKSALASVKPMLFNDKRLTVSVTFRQYEGTEYDKEQGCAVDTFKDLSITALLLYLRVKPGGQGQSRFQNRSAAIMVQQPALTGYTMADLLKDKVILQDVEYEITSFEPILDELYAFELEA